MSDHDDDYLLYGFTTPDEYDDFQKGSGKLSVSVGKVFGVMVGIALGILLLALILGVHIPWVVVKFLGTMVLVVTLIALLIK